MQQVYCFELGKCPDAAVRQRQVECLSQIDFLLAATVAEALGLQAPAAGPELAKPQSSAAFSLIGGTWPVDVRNLAVIFNRGNEEHLAQTAQELTGRGMRTLLVSSQDGQLASGLPIDPRVSLLV
ncbi:MAG: catalase-related domain-containing protein [Glutamicibacter ardleyensis]|uniref:catalase-related domain-containing protein n=1 Tax=Glutamicibacter ardleyensis TaxID=225894 RepID=UPI003F97900C